MAFPYSWGEIKAPTVEAHEHLSPMSETRSSVTASNDVVAAPDKGGAASTRTEPTTASLGRPWVGGGLRPTCAVSAIPDGAGMRTPAPASRLVIPKHFGQRSDAIFLPAEGMAERVPPCF